MLCVVLVFHIDSITWKYTLFRSFQRFPERFRDERFGNPIALLSPNRTNLNRTPRYNDF